MPGLTGLNVAAHEHVKDGKVTDDSSYTVGSAMTWVDDQIRVK
jgi:hypothetical protein